MKKLFLLIFCSINAICFGNWISQDIDSGVYSIDQWGESFQSKKKIPKDRERLFTKKNPKKEKK